MAVFITSVFTATVFILDLGKIWILCYVRK